MAYQRQSLSQTTTLLEIFFCLSSDTSNPNDAGEPYRLAMTLGKTNSIPSADCREWSEFDHGGIFWMARSGMNAKEISDLMNLPYETINDLITRMEQRMREKADLKPKRLPKRL
ncbi:Homeodomain-like DNA binding domain-containing transcription factor [Phycomyces blakesleeanus NRRL 1555(-)]|uniref:Homeodomain-like DNA binding domain-containing transcription factor n=1 Tax=Phycomyces blakesleeanus (strain ATCC 8743b / DSM 1359 / FGSC 10004 / NBRC 33097 / NRRL 1555) TaxID=763407 RepID=A0A163AXE7_PHYB8|nr:Homeodomain-like DNA binding domain-containing transcription factor [Phycomyces blakesleeanus NRRL 1555(-)]OAD76451.1 Homeodomain-like DNA binding domain-containing transcription factor [Phycomyces blakesleeanus NRRL 1555(-)]|eukprot:XP_018294491.1 Homeodomain-like DNA binding domain-containing transcription factor [Phycomyces blakesleeanus NRRL 1555(-)]